LLLVAMLTAMLMAMLMATLMVMLMEMLMDMLMAMMLREQWWEHVMVMLTTAMLMACPSSALRMDWTWRCWVPRLALPMGNAMDWTLRLLDWPLASWEKRTAIG
jgi:hypothetical protein